MVEKTKIQAQYDLPVVVVMIQARKKLQRPKEEEIYPEILKLVITILGFAARLPQPNTYKLQTNRTRYFTVFSFQQNPTVQSKQAFRPWQASRAALDQKRKPTEILVILSSLKLALVS